MIGLVVFDSIGKKVGVVKRIIRENNTNNFSGIEIKGGALKKRQIVLKSAIEEINHTIMLNKRLEKRD